MDSKKMKYNYTGWQVSSLTFLRVLIGWHFLYEGLVKLYAPGWTSKAYLANSVGPVSSLFKSMSQNESTLYVVDFLNEWGLVLIGLSLFVGLLSRPGKIAGMVLLSLYYLAYPPFPALGVGGQVEGSYWLVNKNLIEIGALIVLYLFPSSQATGLDYFIFKKKNNQP